MALIPEKKQTMGTKKLHKASRNFYIKKSNLVGAGAVAQGVRHLP